jgi:hypothetical protein
MEFAGINHTIESFASVFPQPAKKTLMVNANFAVNDLSVKSFLGKNCINQKVKGLSFFTIDIISLPMGVYILSLIGEKDQHFELLFAKT